MERLETLENPVAFLLDGNYFVGGRFGRFRFKFIPHPIPASCDAVLLFHGALGSGVELNGSK